MLEPWMIMVGLALQFKFPSIQLSSIQVSVPEASPLPQNIPPLMDVVPRGEIGVEGLSQPTGRINL